MTDDTMVAGYEVHYGLASGEYDSLADANGATTNSATIEDLLPGKTYYSAVRSRNADASLVSTFSNEVSVTIEASQDTDDDGVPDADDNCPNESNADQANFDGDSQGDVCDADDDNDGVSDMDDSAPFDADNKGEILLLPQNKTDTAEHGKNFGDGLYYTVLSATFESDGSDRLLHVQGFDIDYAGEVAVYLNDSFLGYLSAGPNNALNTPSLWWLPEALQVNGENRIELVETWPGAKWGVTGLGLFATGSAFGNLGTLQDGDITHTAGFELHLPDSTDGYLLEYTGYDVDNGSEIGIDLNGDPLVELPPGANGEWSESTHLVLPGSWLKAGDNVFAIGNLFSNAAIWGVRFERLLPGNAALGSRLPGQATVDWRAASVSYLIPQLADHSTLSLGFYDVDYVRELEIFQDGASLGPVTAIARDAWGTPEEIFVAANEPSVIKIDNIYANQGNIWGVRLEGIGPLP